MRYVFYYQTERKEGGRGGGWKTVYLFGMSLSDVRKRRLGRDEEG